VSVNVTATHAPHQLAIAAWGGGSFGLVLASYGALRPVRDALVLDGSPDTLPWLFTTTFAAVVVLAPLWSRALARWPPRAVVVAVFHAFAACELAFAAFVHADVAPLWVGRAFYVWSAVFNLFVVSIVWSALADMLPTRAARHWYGPVSAGGTLGAIVGPFATGRLLGDIGIAGVLVASALLLELAAACVARACALGDRRDRISTARDRAVPALPPMRLREAIGRIAGSRYLAALVGYVVCTACAATLVYV
jgi:ATP:ADP antiporter, AAA family